MANQNKSIGRFHLDGIPPAPRGVPQIEVTFDIDANGIVHVSAKDLGTGKENNITITSNTNMSKDDIDNAVKEAESYAADDKKRREAVDVRNNADQLIYQSEKTVTEFGDKLSEDEKKKIETAREALKEAMKGEDIEAIKAKQEELQKEVYAVSEKVYKAAADAQQAAQGGAQQAPNGGETGANGDPNVYEADYTDVDDKDKK